MLDVNSSSVKFQQDEPMHEMPTLQCSEWTYTMRRNMQEIVPGLFLGPYSSAQKHCLKTLRDHGISHIICVRQDIEAQYIKPQINDLSITYLTLNIADTATENIIRFFPTVRQFIDEAFQRNGKVLVHGNNGISRSATLVLAYIMEKYGLSSKEAIECVKQRRGCIHPNEGFLAQLIEYEPIYKARQTLEKGETSNDNKRLKRKSEQLCESIDYDLIQPPPSPISDNNNHVINCQPDFSNHLYKLWMMKKS
ncbi:serine/threonine/tyrosine-interacting protein-like [Tribolium madens]|uniref:serine/threonine/tyrosine-interacting protein-like n=1 Tax=Tribolium madens TaxID=41895 RepID=UPI001CF7464C|nr:serine/threonine/tyrosine-interacting protein-like [Tribolium madens]